MPSNEQRRQTAQRKLERQLERRAERDRKRKQMTIGASVLGVVLVIAAGAVVYGLTRSDDSSDATAAEATPTQERTSVERTSERELVVTRTIDGPRHIVFDAWSTPELLKRWWVPRSVPITLLSVEMDVRVGGTYRLVFQADPTTTMAFFGRYLEVDPPSRLVWTNEEGEGDAVVTTVTFEEDQGRTLLVVRDLYPSKDALDGAIASESMPGWAEMFDQLDELLVGLDSGSGRA